MIPYGRQDISEEDIKSVIDVLQSDLLTQGPAATRFEDAVSDHCGIPYALSVSSATSALHIACLALNLGPGDWLWTSPVTFVASSNCALYCGAQVDFVDIDPRTYNLSVERLEEKLLQAERQGRLPKIVVPVHLCGQSCDMATIAKLANKYGFRVIEDASHAVGGLYRGEPIGNCRYSDITIFSFHPVKIITTGEGGMVLTRTKNLADKMALFRSHGITRDPDLMTCIPDGPWYYQQIELGFNYRMTDIQAALGASQMKRLTSIVERRQQLAERYDEALAGLPLTIPWQHPDTESARHLYVIRLLSDPGEGFHRRIFEKLRAAGIGVNLHYIPVYLQPYYQTIGFKVGLCPEAERYYAQAISLPLYYGLADEEQDEVVIAVTRAISS